MSTNVLECIDFTNNAKLTEVDLDKNAYLCRIVLPNQPYLKTLAVCLDMSTEIDDVVFDGVQKSCQIEINVNSSTLK
jgi:hypothetical protein